jgi:hypothetical protein
MRRKTVLIFAISLLFFAPGWTSVYAADSMTITGENLARVRTSAEFLAIPGLAGLIKKLNADQTLGLVVRFPGGETGQILGGRIESWLIAHGLSSRRIALEIGAGSDDGVEILLRPMQ